MKALTLYQPWASLIAHGHKAIETRSWYTYYRGEIAIHAGLKFTKAMQGICLLQPFRSALESSGIHSVHDMPLGCVVCTCKIVGCKPVAEIVLPTGDELRYGDYSEGRYAWLLDDVRRFDDPFDAQGARGLWEWDTTTLLPHRVM